AGGAFEGVLVPVAVLGEGLQGVPVLCASQADEGLGDGVLLDVEDQSGEPLLEAGEAGVGEGVGAGQQQFLPEAEQLGSLHGAPPCLRSSVVAQLLTTSARAVPFPIPRSNLREPSCTAKTPLLTRNYWIVRMARSCGRGRAPMLTPALTTARLWLWPTPMARSEFGTCLPGTSGIVSAFR